METVAKIARLLNADVTKAKPYTAYGIDPSHIWRKKKLVGLWMEVNEKQRVAIIDKILIKQKGYSHFLGSFPPSVGSVSINETIFLLETPVELTPPNLNLARVQ